MHRNEEIAGFYVAVQDPVLLAGQQALQCHLHVALYIRRADNGGSVSYEDLQIAVHVLKNLQATSEMMRCSVNSLTQRLAPLLNAAAWAAIWVVFS